MVRVVVAAQLYPEAIEVDDDRHPQKLTSEVDNAERKLNTSKSASEDPRGSSDLSSRDA